MISYWRYLLLLTTFFFIKLLFNPLAHTSSWADWFKSFTGEETQEESKPTKEKAKRQEAAIPVDEPTNPETLFLTSLGKEAGLSEKRREVYADYTGKLNASATAVQSKMKDLSSTHPDLGDLFKEILVPPITNTVTLIKTPSSYSEDDVTSELKLWYSKGQDPLRKSVLSSIKSLEDLEKKIEAFHAHKKKSLQKLSTKFDTESEEDAETTLSSILGSRSKGVKNDLISDLKKESSEDSQEEELLEALEIALRDAAQEMEKLVKLLKNLHKSPERKKAVEAASTKREKAAAKKAQEHKKSASSKSQPKPYVPQWSTNTSRRSSTYPSYAGSSYYSPSYYSNSSYSPSSWWSQGGETSTGSKDTFGTQHTKEENAKTSAQKDDDSKKDMRYYPAPTKEKAKEKEADEEKSTREEKQKKEQEVRTALEKYTAFVDELQDIASNSISDLEPENFDQIVKEEESVKGALRVLHKTKQLPEKMLASHKQSFRKLASRCFVLTCSRGTVSNGMEKFVHEYGFLNYTLKEEVAQQSILRDVITLVFVDKFQKRTTLPKPLVKIIPNSPAKKSWEDEKAQLDRFIKLIPTAVARKLPEIEQYQKNLDFYLS